MPRYISRTRMLAALRDVLDSAGVDLDHVRSVTFHYDRVEVERFKVPSPEQYTEEFTWHGMIEGEVIPVRFDD